VTAACAARKGGGRQEKGLCLTCIAPAGDRQRDAKARDQRPSWPRLLLERPLVRYAIRRAAQDQRGPAICTRLNVVHRQTRCRGWAGMNMALAFLAKGE